MTRYSRRGNGTDWLNSLLFDLLSESNPSYYQSACFSCMQHTCHKRFPFANFTFSFSRSLNREIKAF